MEPRTDMTTLMRYLMGVLTVNHRRQSFLADPTGDLASQGLGEVSGDDVLRALETLRSESVNVAKKSDDVDLTDKAKMPDEQLAKLKDYIAERRVPPADGGQGDAGGAGELIELTTRFEVDELDRSVVEQALGEPVAPEAVDHHDDPVDPAEDFGAGAPVAAEGSDRQDDDVADPAEDPGASEPASTEVIGRSGTGSDKVPAPAVAEEGGVLGDDPATPLGERQIDYDDAPREVLPEPEPAPPEPVPPPPGDPRTPPWGGGGTTNLPGKTDPTDQYNQSWDDRWGENPFGGGEPPWEWLDDIPDPQDPLVGFPEDDPFDPGET